MTSLLPDIPQIPIDKVHLGEGTFVDLLRLDSVHLTISGNKWFKLKGNLEETFSRGKTGILTFGGAFSNHIAATASACRLAGLRSLGVIRGEKVENPTLSKAAEEGMEFHFISREDYRNKESISWEKKFPGFHIVPEGGSNEQGVQGAVEIHHYIPTHYSYVCLAVGSGGTLAGLLRAPLSNQLIGIPVLKNSRFLEEVVRQLSRSDKTPRWFHQYHRGGYAKFDRELLEFMRIFYEENKIMLDPVYTSKMLLGLKNEISSENLKGEILAIHTGGLQGIAGMESRLGENIY